MEFTTFIGVLVIAMLTVTIGVPVGKFIDRKISERYPTKNERKIASTLSSIQTSYTDMHEMTKDLKPMWKEMVNMTKKMGELIPKDL